MTKVDIFSGFLGAGKTTLIKKLVSEGFKGEKLVLIENEFGEIGIDGGFLKDAGIEITEMNSGCICCTLVGDFGEALKKVMSELKPDRIIIEPSGVGKLSDVIKAITDVSEEAGITVNNFIAVVDASKAKMYMKNFGEFFNNQIEYAKTVILSRTQNVSESKLAETVALIREHNDKAVLITTPWDELTGEFILEAMEKKSVFEQELLEAAEQIAAEHEHDHEHHHHDHEHHHHDHEHHHDHDEDDDDDACPCCGGHHDHDEECDHEHEHHHHDHEHHHHDHEHHHHDEDDDDDVCPCCGGHHDHDEECDHDHEHHHEHEHHHHHHHADEVFTSIGIETTKKYTEEQINNILKCLENEHEYGIILRAKGIVAASEGQWIHFDYVPEESDIRRGSSDVIGKICVIGSKIEESKIKALFA